MRIKTYPVDKYMGCPIYIRNFGDVFEYLVVVKGEIYTTFFEQTLSLWRRLTGRGRTQVEEEEAVKLAKVYAYTTIEHVLSGDSSDSVTPQ